MIAIKKESIIEVNIVIPVISTSFVKNFLSLTNIQNKKNDMTLRFYLNR